MTKEYKSGPGFQEQKAKAKKLNNEELLEAFQGAYLKAVTHGECQRPGGFPFYRTADDGLHLLASGEWYQALKEEILARASSTSVQETVHDDRSALE